jgi:hypothetical protein
MRGVKVCKHYHDKRECDIHIVCLADRLDRDTFNEFRAEAKSRGGWYSRSWKGSPAGFAFEDEETAQEFAEHISGDDNETPPEPPKGPSEEQQDQEPEALSTHRALQLSNTQDTCESKARTARGAAKNLDDIGNTAGAEHFRSKARRLDAIADKCKTKIAPDPESALREMWTAQGVQEDEQNKVVEQVTEAAQPGAKVGPFTIPEKKPDRCAEESAPEACEEPEEPQDLEPTKPHTMALVKELKEAGQDFEWYPTTKELLAPVAASIRRKFWNPISFLDIGAGDGRTDANYRTPMVSAQGRRV